MNQNVESRLRQALSDAAVTVDPNALRPLTAPRRHPFVPFVKVGALMATASALIVAFGALTVLRPAVPDQERTPAPRGATALVAFMNSMGGDVTVFMCQRESPFTDCPEQQDGGTAATKAQIDAVERRLRSMPEVESVVFEDRRSAFEEFRRQYAGDNDLIAAITVDDLPESWRVDLRQGADPRPVIEAAKAMPGVALVVDQRCARERKDQAERC